MLNGGRLFESVGVQFFSAISLSSLSLTLKLTEDSLIFAYAFDAGLKTCPKELSPP